MLLLGCSLCLSFVGGLVCLFVGWLFVFVLELYSVVFVIVFDVVVVVVVVCCLLVVGRWLVGCWLLVVTCFVACC